MEGNDETAASATSLPTSPVYDGQSFPAPSLSVLSNKGKMNDTVASAVSLVQAFQGYADARSGALTKRSHSELIKQGNEEASATKRSHSEMINQGDEEASATKSAVKLPQIDETAWAEALKRIPRCSAVEGIRESSVFCNQPLQGTGGRNHCLRKLLREIGSLNESLPSNPAIFIRFDCETPQFLRACITAPADTPYAYGLFLFDIFIPDNYPQVPPKFHLLTTGNGSVRFSPNLYADGKVCLSLLNTWSGPKWNQNSTLLQVLVSIQVRPEKCASTLSICMLIFSFSGRCRGSFLVSSIRIIWNLDTAAGKVRSRMDMEEITHRMSSDMKIEFGLERSSLPCSIHSRGALDS